MRITERRLRSIIRSVIRESRADKMIDYHVAGGGHPDYEPERERNSLMNPSDSQVHPMNVGNRRENPYDRAVRIAKEHCPDCIFDGKDYVYKIPDSGDLYGVQFNDGDVLVHVPGEFEDSDEVKVFKNMNS